MFLDFDFLFRTIHFNSQHDSYRRGRPRMQDSVCSAADSRRDGGDVRDFSAHTTTCILPCIIQAELQQHFDALAGPTHISSRTSEDSSQTNYQNGARYHHLLRVMRLTGELFGVRSRPVLETCTYPCGLLEL